MSEIFELPRKKRRRRPVSAARVARLRLEREIFREPLIPVLLRLPPDQFQRLEDERRVAAYGSVPNRCGLIRQLISEAIMWRRSIRPKDPPRRPRACRSSASIDRGARRLTGGLIFRANDLLVRARRMPAFPLLSTQTEVCVPSQQKGNSEILVRGQKKFVAYYRVSTDKRGVRGLGMDAQAAAVAAFVRSHDGRIFASFEEVESGRKNDRPQLEAAITRAKILGATA